ncbi:MAG: HNH endonuclease, partial [Microbacterium gubbeenense]
MSKLTGLHEALSRLNDAWADADDSNNLSREQLIAATNAIGVLQRRLDAVHVGVAAGVASESRTDLGSDSLAKQHGFRTPAKLIAA